MSAIGYRKTGTSDASWDAGANQKNLSNDDGESEYRQMYAWVDPDGDPDAKGSYKFPHHFVSSGGEVGDASTVGCSAGIGVLNGGRGGADIPDSDRQGVYNHLSHHLKDSGQEDIPELKSQIREPVRRFLESKGEERAYNSKSVEIREADDGSLLFTGYATTFNSEYDILGGPPYGWTESVDPGAFTKTLSENPDVRLLVNHDDLPLARTRSGTLQLSQDNIGLRVEAKLDPSDPDVQRLQPKMARGDLNEMSFAFRTIRQAWDEDYTRRNLVELSLADGDVSIVTFPANPATSADLRALVTLTERLYVAPEGVLAEMRASGQDPLELVRKAHKGLARLVRATRDVDTDEDDDPGAIAQAVDAAIDEALNVWDENVDQAQALVQAADLAVDHLLEVLGVPDADEEGNAEPAYTLYLSRVRASRPQRLHILRRQLDLLALSGR